MMQRQSDVNAWKYEIISALNNRLDGDDDNNNNDNSDARNFNHI